jgi:hypothetical protein
MPSANDSASDFEDDNDEEQQYLRLPAIDATKADVEEVSHDHYSNASADSRSH